jgi:hypothetical protein
MILLHAGVSQGVVAPWLRLGRAAPAPHSASPSRAARSSAPPDGTGPDRLRRCRGQGSSHVENLLTWTAWRSRRSATSSPKRSPPGSGKSWRWAAPSRGLHPRSPGLRAPRRRRGPGPHFQRHAMGMARSDLLAAMRHGQAHRLRGADRLYRGRLLGPGGSGREVPEALRDDGELLL